MSEHDIHNFGVVEDKGDFYEFRWSDDETEKCSLDQVIQTERGPRRTELAIIPTHIWKLLSDRTIRELATGMGETERTKKLPTLKVGINRLSPLIGRELAVLLWALMEVVGDGSIEAILHGWRELAREERWWLYAKGAGPGQRSGVGWRLALFHALSEITDSRSVEPVAYEKKKSRRGSRSSRKSVSKKRLGPRKESNENKKLQQNILAKDLKKNETKTPPEKKVRNVGQKATTAN